ncbi:hypothetical protein BDV36DRAFT_290163 [Aspergillus pseudocaelatus]|uniref:Cytochrome b5 heme-binding domain-containing protein n=1 Tax=Aspergillus pseudocaelatus TaxID=1825620 RepID=A0ABQ6X2F0_9EURO|nr:hypothetical protein BDV36DRAFT_290163 [Aspergillus pseudocaelatus]
MGWLSLRSTDAAAAVEGESTHTTPLSNMISMYSEHAENTATATTCLPQLLQQEDFSFQEPSLSDSDLPYIDPSIVSLVYQQWRSSSDATGKHLQVWIIIDNVVYDCTQFQREHPGGIDVIQSFVGQDCSWQF